MKVLDNLNLRDEIPGACTGTKWLPCSSPQRIPAISPIDNRVLARIIPATAEDCQALVKKAETAFSYWKSIPAPQRGDFVRRFGQKLRSKKGPLARLITLETGKLYQEALGEVQEAIDICDYAVGQSRMLYGMTTVSERIEHRLFEQYHPLGIVGIITAFNFPVAVWSWNFAIATICGDVSIWKPSSKSPLTAIALQNILAGLLAKDKHPEGIFSLLIGERTEVGNSLVTDRRIPLLSFTGSVTSGKIVASTVAERLGKSILELGGNNAIIISKHADLQRAIPAVVFGAVGTSGQRCTTTRRLIIHEEMYKEVKNSLITAYKGIRVGNPFKKKTHMGPLIDENAALLYAETVLKIKDQGGRILSGGNRLQHNKYPSKAYVEPSLVEAEANLPMVAKERFVPILYLLKYKGSVEQAIALNNGVSQGLSSSIFSNDLTEVERFLCARGSDCGLANVNIGTSGAEIGGAFGGEKDTGGGRESGSDAWKAYMRRQTVTINYGSSLPLAQGISFSVSSD